MENNTKSPSPILNGTYYVVQSFMVNELQLKGLEKEIYALIFGYCQNGRHFYCGSLSLLQKWTCSSKVAVIKTLKNLIEKGFLFKEVYTFPNTNITTNRYYALAYENKIYTPDEILGVLK